MAHNIHDWYWTVIQVLHFDYTNAVKNRGFLDRGFLEGRLQRITRFLRAPNNAKMFPELHELQGF